MSKFLKIMACIIGVVVVVVVGMFFYARYAESAAVQKAFSQLDYKTMDTKGYTHESIETAAKACVNSCLSRGQTTSICESRCVCSLNKTVEIFSKEEFNELDAALSMKIDPKPELKDKMIKIATACRS